MSDVQSKEPQDNLLPLNVQHLTHRVDKQCILNDVNFCLDSRDMTIIMGPNGAGKSALIRLLHGLYPATHGTIMWGAHDMMQSHRRIRAQQAMVFQKPVLLRRSVRGNVQFANHTRAQSLSTEQINQLLTEFNLHDLANQPARSLSGGEQQRLALARAMACQPQVLFLDEPTANLDPASVYNIERRLQHIQQAGVKIIMVTHDRDQARRLGNDILFLHRGALCEHRAASDFFNSPTSTAAQRYLEGEILL